MKKCKFWAQSIHSSLLPHNHTASVCVFMCMCVLALHHVCPVLLNFLKLHTYGIFPMHITHTHPPSTTTRTHCSDVSKPFSIRSCCSPSPASTIFHHVAMALHWDIRQTPRIGCRFPLSLSCCLSPKRATMQWCHLTSLQMLLKEDGRACQLPLIDWINFFRKRALKN